MNRELSELIDMITSISIILGVFFSYFQIRKAAKSIEVGQKANAINVLNSFTKEYDRIILESEECITSKKVATWYFRFWNLMTNEYLFFSKGLLDRNIFEFWCYKLCLYYNSKPTKVPYKKVRTYKLSHLEYMVSHNGSYPKSDAFFRELMEIADKEKNKDEMAKKVHKLVKKYCKVNC
ncbi:MAG: hypothetical protein WC788_07915 [Candidatus Paceibacterota bacterium]|jgi:hypothetical protein